MHAICRSICVQLEHMTDFLVNQEEKDSALSSAEVRELVFCCPRSFWVAMSDKPFWLGISNHNQYWKQIHYSGSGKNKANLHLISLVS
jgi:hypothetical protein